MNSHSDTLEIRMLGDFSLIWNGAPVSLGKSTGAKFLSFVQMLMLAGREGLDRDEIARVLFDGDDLANVTNSLNNLVYQARKQISRAGLPDGIGISRVKDRYVFISSVPVSIDALRFAAILGDTDKEPAEDQLREAVALYGGDLLPAVKGNKWIEDRRETLRGKWQRAVERLASICRERGDISDLIRVYTDASECDKNRTGEFDAALILSLIDAGDHKNALKQYNKAIRFYQSQGKGRIPERLERCAERLSMEGGDGSSLKSDLLDVMRSDVGEDEANADGAFYCNYPSFIDAVKHSKRSIVRDPRPVTLMLLTLRDYEGKPLRMEKKQIRYSEELSRSIRDALRVGDIYTRYDETSFLVLLPAANEENAVAIFDRIAHRLKEKAGGNASLQFRMLSLNDLPESAPHPAK